MKSLGSVLSILLAITLPSCTPRKTEAVASLERVVATQDRVNRYFHKGVAPRMMSCWTGLAGEGTMAIEIGYRRDGRLWAAGNSGIRSSTLAKDQAEVALRCFQEAVRDTSFPVERGDGEAKEFLVKWSFPVPWPKDITEVAMRMSVDTGKGGGCGGPEAPPPACQDCFFIPIFSISYCASTCAGYSNCTPEPNGCKMGPITPKCVTVSPFGNLGGLVMYGDADVLQRK